jgi:hypothetical protein
MDPFVSLMYSLIIDCWFLYQLTVAVPNTVKVGPTPESLLTSHLVVTSINCVIYLVHQWTELEFFDANNLNKVKIELKT